MPAPSASRRAVPPAHGSGRRRGGVLDAPRFGRQVAAGAACAALLAGFAAGAVIGRPGAGAAADGTVAGGDVAARAPGYAMAGVVPDPFGSASALRGTAARSQLPERTEPPPAPARATPAAPAVVDPAAVDAAGLTFGDRQAGLLSADVPAAGSGELVVVPGSTPPAVVGPPVRTVRVEVEAGLPVDPELVAATVMSALQDPRGWGADGSLTFARTDGAADIRVVLATPATVDALCAPLETVGRYSCGRNGHAALNYERWVRATPEFADRTRYREYLVNHEVGHLLGHPHVGCAGTGLRAQVMQQQSVRVAPCTPNGWPFPDGA